MGEIECTSIAKLSSSLGSCQAFSATTASFSSPSSTDGLVEG